MGEWNRSGRTARYAPKVLRATGARTATLTGMVKRGLPVGMSRNGTMATVVPPVLPATSAKTAGLTGTAMRGLPAAKNPAGERAPDATVLPVDNAVAEPTSHGTGSVVASVSSEQIVRMVFIF